VAEGIGPMKSGNLNEHKSMLKMVPNPTGDGLEDKGGNFKEFIPSSILP